MIYDSDLFLNYIAIFTQGMAVGFVVGFSAWAVGFVLETFMHLIRSW